MDTGSNQASDGVFGREDGPLGKLFIYSLSHFCRQLDDSDLPGGSRSTPGIPLPIFGFLLVPMPSGIGGTLSAARDAHRRVSRPAWAAPATLLLIASYLCLTETSLFLLLQARAQRYGEQRRLCMALTFVSYVPTRLALFRFQARRQLEFATLVLAFCPPCSIDCRKRHRGRSGRPSLLTRGPRVVSAAWRDAERRQPPGSGSSYTRSCCWHHLPRGHIRRGRRTEPASPVCPVSSAWASHRWQRMPGDWLAAGDGLSVPFAFRTTSRMGRRSVPRVRGKVVSHPSDEARARIPESQRRLRGHRLHRVALSASPCDERGHLIVGSRALRSPAAMVAMPWRAAASGS